MWKRAAKAAGIGTCLSVGTRHSLASKMYEEGERKLGREIDEALSHKGKGMAKKHYIRGREE